MSNEEQLFNMIADNFKTLHNDFSDLKKEINNKFDKIEGKLETYVKKEDCKKNRINCVNQLNLKNKEISIKKIVAIGTIVTGCFGGASMILVAILKIFYPNI